MVLISSIERKRINSDKRNRDWQIFK